MSERSKRAGYQGSSGSGSRGGSSGPSSSSSRQKRGGGERGGRGGSGQREEPKKTATKPVTTVVPQPKPSPSPAPAPSSSDPQVTKPKPTSWSGLFSSSTPAAPPATPVVVTEAQVASSTTPVAQASQTLSQPPSTSQPSKPAWGSTSSSSSSSSSSASSSSIFTQTPEPSPSLSSGARDLLQSIEQLSISGERRVSPEDSCRVQRGLVNLGNLCFMNSVLQVLIRVPSLRKLILSTQCYRMPVKTLYCDTLASFILEYEGLQKNQIDHSSSPFFVFPEKVSFSQRIEMEKPFIPDHLFDILPNFNNRGARADQEDAQEFLCWILDKIHEELLQVENILKKTKPIESIPSTPNDEDEWQEVGTGGRSTEIITFEYQESLVFKIFASRLKSTLIKGSKSSVSFQPYLCLPLDISNPSIKSIESALQRNFSFESIDGFKSAQDQSIKATKRSKIDALPEILVFQVQRFCVDEEGAYKITRKVSYPQSLVIEPSWFHNPRAAPGLAQRTFRLFGVISHVGENVSRGHYTCDVFCNHINRWVKFDDNNHINTDPVAVLAREAYLLFYQRS